MALAQLNRTLQYRADKRPVVADLRESGAMEQDADVVAFIYRHDTDPDSADTDTAELIIARHRNGPTAQIHLRRTPGGRVRTQPPHCGMTTDSRQFRVGAGSAAGGSKCWARHELDECGRS